MRKSSFCASGKESGGAKLSKKTSLNAHYNKKALLSGAQGLSLSKQSTLPQLQKGISPISGLAVFCFIRSGGRETDERFSQKYV